jgi:hypothetical protein
MTHNTRDDYEVGYKKPPKATQFKKGASGNPKGRPKKNRLKPNREHVDAQVAHMMLRPHNFSENGEIKSLPFIVWLLKKLQADAMKGNRFAQRTLLDWFTGTLKRRESDKMKMIEVLRSQDIINFENALDIMENY